MPASARLSSQNDRAGRRDRCSCFSMYEGQNPGQAYVVDAACLFGPTNTYRLVVVDDQLKLSNNHKNMLWIITFVPLWIAIGRCAIRCNTSSHPPDGLVVMFEKTSSIKGLLVPGVLPLVRSNVLSN